MRDAPPQSFAENLPPYCLPAVFLECKQSGVRASYTVTVVDQAAEEPQDKRLSGVKEFGINPPGGNIWGWRQAVTKDELRTRAYLAGDKLKLRGTVAIEL